MTRYRVLQRVGFMAKAPLQYAFTQEAFIAMLAVFAEVLGATPPDTAVLYGLMRDGATAALDCRKELTEEFAVRAVEQFNLIVGKIK